MTDASSVARLLAEAGRRAALFSDFDGTLASIVADPEKAVPLPGVRDDLLALAERLGRVGVVSGRPAQFLVDRLQPPAGSTIELYGLHGIERLERSPPGEPRVVPVEAARPYAERVRDALDEARRCAIPHLALEDKRYSFTLHWRNVPADLDEASAAEIGHRGLELASSLAISKNFQLHAGKASAELVPPIGIDKGTVVAERGAGFDVVVFIGDDTGDVPGFAALDRLFAKGAAVARVAVSSDEAPPELIERADLVLDDPRAAAALLREVARA